LGDLSYKQEHVVGSCKSVIVVFNFDNGRPMDWLLCRKEEPVQVQDDTQPAGHGDAIRAVAFDLHNSLFASVGDDKLVKLWDATAWTCIKTVYGCPPPVIGTFFNCGFCYGFVCPKRN
jgi:WD40 repeat protein